MMTNGRSLGMWLTYCAQHSACGGHFVCCAMMHAFSCKVLGAGWVNGKGMQ